MELHVFDDRPLTGASAAELVAQRVNDAIAHRGWANLVLATGTSQFEMLDALTGRDVDWTKVSVFHLDEYVGLGDQHPASFVKYLVERFVEPVRALGAFHPIQGDAPDPQAECERVGAILEKHPVDVACVGIGENGHLAFNDPPADFTTSQRYLVVELDEDCRKQQVGEGWFESLQDVPTHAISMSIRQILDARTIVCTVPDRRKARAVREAVEGRVNPRVPASILQRHDDCHLFLDAEAAGLLADRGGTA